MQRAAAKRHHYPGESGERDCDLSGGREGFTWFHRFRLDRIQLASTNTKFRRVGCLGGGFARWLLSGRRICRRSERAVAEFPYSFSRCLPSLFNNLRRSRSQYRRRGITPTVGEFHALGPTPKAPRTPAALPGPS